MHQNKVIKQLKTLKAVKADQSWTQEMKSEILSEKGSLSILERIQETLFAPIQKPVLAIAPLVLTAAVLGGLLVYLNVLPQLSDVPIITTFIPENGLSEQTLASLSKVEASLTEVNKKLEGLKRAGNTGQALVTAQAAQISAQRGKEIVGNMSGQDQTDQTLASLSGLCNEVEQKAVGIQKQKVSQLLKEMKGRSLDNKDRARLDVAKQYYKQGQYVDAFLLIQQI